MTKQLMEEFPFIRKRPVVEQLVLELPLPSPLSGTKRLNREEKEETLRGVWTIDI